jgi:Ca2+-binding RTX toxin-like protein
MAIVNGTDNFETLNALDGVTNGVDNISGYGGNDLIFGLSGDDYIVGGTGADALDGGPGSDTASYFTSAAGIIASLSAGVGGDAEGDTYTKSRTSAAAITRTRSSATTAPTRCTDWRATTSSTA